MRAVYKRTGNPQEVTIEEIEGGIALKPKGKRGIYFYNSFDELARNWEIASAWEESVFVD